MHLIPKVSHGMLDVDYHLIALLKCRWTFSTASVLRFSPELHASNKDINIGKT